MRKFIAECIATYMLVLFGTGAIVLNEIHPEVTHTIISLTFGLIVCVMIIIFGRISGAHMNPAVSIAQYLGKEMKVTELVVFLTAQITGAFLASFTLLLLFSHSKNYGATLPSGSELHAFGIEFAMTFLLALGAFYTSRKFDSLFVVALAVGLIVGLEAFFGGPYTGASMNPARSLSPALVSGNFEHLWLYIFAPIAGAIAAIFVANLLIPKK